jgi:hypothetical protein
MDPVDPLHHFGRQLVDRETEAAARARRVVARYLPGGDLRVDAQADIEILPRRTCIFEDQRGALDLLRGIEDDVIGQADDLVEVFGLVSRAIGADLAIVEFGRQPRFVKAGGADPVEIFPDDRRGGKHAERLQGGQHLDIRRVANVRQHLTIRAQLRGVDDESGAVDAVQIELGESPRIAGSGFHQSLYPHTPNIRSAR